MKYFRIYVMPCLVITLGAFFMGIYDSLVYGQLESHRDYILISGLFYLVFSLSEIRNASFEEDEQEDQDWAEEEDVLSKGK